MLIPTAWTAIPANEPRAGKMYELLVWGTCTTGLTGTLITTPRYGTVIGGTSLGASAAQTYVASVTTAPFLFTARLAFRSIGNAGANSTATVSTVWTSAGTAAVAGSVTMVVGGGGAAVSVDTSVASALWIGVTFSVAPSVIPRGHIWRSLN